MKRDITAEVDNTFKSPEHQKGHEAQFERMVSFMMDEISQRFRNQAIGGLQVKTVNKFADSIDASFESEIEPTRADYYDAQIGNYASVYLKLADRTKRKLTKQFDDKRIVALTKQLLNKTNATNRSKLYAAVEKRVGISSAELIATEGLSSTVNALELETAQWVKKLRDDTIQDYTANSLRVMASGGSLEDVLEQFSGLEEKRKNHAKFTARNQIANYSSLLTKARAQNLGITTARWVTARDERVRPCHKVRDKKEFDLSKGLYASCDGKHLLPAIDFNCRCDYELIIPKADDDG